MNLMINTFGAYVHRRGEMFAVKIEGKTQEIAARKVRSILITTGASFSTDAIQLAVENNIDVIFMDKYGDPYGRVWHGRPGSTTSIRRAQLRLADTPNGGVLALGWTLRKLDNQLEFLEKARKKRTRLSAELTAKLDELRVLRTQITSVQGNLDDIRMTLMGLEGRAGRVYWQAINLLLPDQFQFQVRSRNPAQDEFNCLLNYAYGVLYGSVERACILAGLDPYVGFVHTDHYNKPSLVFDLIECYRIWADETVVSLFAARQVNKEMFDPLHNGLTLNAQGKIILMQRFEQYLDESLRYRNRNIKRRDTIQFDCYQIANKLLDEIS